MVLTSPGIYKRIVWGYKNNAALMNSLQTIQNKADKFILDRYVYSSTTDALKPLNWLDLKIRRSAQRRIYMYKVVNNHRNRQ